MIETWSQLVERVRALAQAHREDRNDQTVLWLTAGEVRALAAAQAYANEQGTYIPEPRP
jgi:hypothetical protein